MNSLKDKWGEIQKSPITPGALSPLKDGIEQMVGLVQKKVGVKTLH